MRFILSAILSLLVVCSAQAQFPNPFKKDTGNQKQLPPGEIARSQNATFRPGDVFEMRIMGIPVEDMSSFALQYTLSGEGMINIPLAGQIRAVGMTQSQLETAIENKLKEAKIFTTPTAVITVAPSARFVTIGGNVRGPQRMPWSADLTLAGAINACGGAGEFGGDKISLTRNSEVYQYSLKAIKAEPKKDPKLLPGDQIELL